MAFLSGEAGRPLTARELEEEMEIPKAERRSFRSVIDNLVDSGLLIRIKGGRFASPSRVNLVTGRIQITGYGDGFVAPDDGTADVHVSAAQLGGAMDGDTVVVRVERQPSRGRKADGRVIRVVERARMEVVAFFEQEEGISMAHPQDPRTGSAVLIPPGKEGDAHPGDLIVVSLTAYPERGRLARGSVAEVLGDPLSLEAQTGAVIHSQGLPHRFPKKALSEAASLSRKPEPEDLKGREDLRHLPFVTIDGVKAKDFDDALFAILDADGSIDLYVSIADVSHYVPPGSAMDKEALHRGNSVYFPESVIPMLPERISNGLCSLRPGETRLSFTCQIRVDRKGNPVDHRLYPSVIRSAARLTYRQVEDYLTGQKGLPGEADAALESLAALETVFRRLEKRRRARNSLDFDLPEPEVVLNLTGQVENIYRAERYSSHRLVEECMLLANEIVGNVLKTSGRGGVFRVHEPPTPERIQELNLLLASQGLRVPASASTPAPFARILDKAVEDGKGRFLNTVILRSMMRARYSPDPLGHFALALTDYAHFTSPIRRYADLVVHRILKGLLGFSSPWAPADPEPLCAHISDTERRAEAAHRDLLAWLRTKFMAERIGEAFAGVISAVTSFGFFVELEEYFIEGLVHLSALHDDYYTFHEDRLLLIGENTGRVFAIGNRVKVEVADVNLARRHVDFHLVGDVRDP